MFSSRLYHVQLKKDIREYYGYNGFMVDTMLGMFTVAEALELIEANEGQAAHHTAHQHPQDAPAGSLPLR